MFGALTTSVTAPTTSSAAADEAVVLGPEALDDVTELVVAGDDAALVTEDSAFAAQQPAHEPAEAEQSALASAQEAAEYRHPGRSRYRTRRSEAQAEHEPGCTYPSFRLPMQFSLIRRHHAGRPTAAFTAPGGCQINSGLPTCFRHGANGGSRR